MKDITGLREGLAETFEKLKAGTEDLDKASQLINCAGKMIGTLRVEMEYADRRSEKPEIKFMLRGDE